MEDKQQLYCWLGSIISDKRLASLLADKKDTVPLNYNFILTLVSTSGAAKYFACQRPEFPVEICISTRRDVVFTRDVAFYTWQNCDFYTRHGCAH